MHVLLDLNIDNVLSVFEVQNETQLKVLVRSRDHTYFDSYSILNYFY